MSFDKPPNVMCVEIDNSFQCVMFAL